MIEERNSVSLQAVYNDPFKARHNDSTDENLGSQFLYILIPIFQVIF